MAYAGSFLKSAIILTVALPVLAQRPTTPDTKRSPQGKLISGCADPRWQGKKSHCAWVSRYLPPNTSAEPQLNVPQTDEQIAVENAMGDLKPVQPPQVKGTEAIALVPGQSDSAFRVVFLSKTATGWEIDKIVDAPEPERK